MLKVTAPKLRIKELSLAVEHVFKLFPDSYGHYKLGEEELLDLVEWLRKTPLEVALQTLSPKKARSLAVHLEPSWSEELRAKAFTVLMARLDPRYSHLLVPSYFEFADHGELKSWLKDKLKNSYSSKDEVAVWKKLADVLFSNPIQYQPIIHDFIESKSRLNSLSQYFGIKSNQSLFAKSLLKTFSETAPIGVFASRNLREWESFLAKDEAELSEHRALLATRMIQALAEKPERESIFEVILKHFGDPRKAQHESHWREFPPNTVEFFKRWLVGREVTDFFKGLKGEEDRLNFWKSQVPVIATTERLANGRAFLMHIHGHVFIEFVTKGNALYIYTEESINSLNVRKAITEEQLKNRQTVLKVMVHQQGWQDRVRDFIGVLKFQRNRQTRA